jgi:hypothetical protein
MTKPRPPARGVANDAAANSWTNLIPVVDAEAPTGAQTDTRPREIGGRKGLDPTRYGDWEKDGRCIDF